MTVVCLVFVTGLVPRFRAGNFGRGLALMVRALLRPRLLAVWVCPRCARIRENAEVLASGPGPGL